MLYTKNLENIIFERHKIHHTDELLIISGYLGPKPVERLNELPFHTRVIYGMYGSEGIQSSLHKSLVNIQKSSSNVKIFYSQIPVHSKCYIWKNKGKISHALIGSANFSINGLTTPYREVLAETTLDTFDPLDDYAQFIINNCISCFQGEEVLPKSEQKQKMLICFASLLDKNGEVQNSAGLNWGQNPNNHTRPNDAYIPIRTDYIRECPDLFPPKKLIPQDSENGRSHRHNDCVEIIWDDGTTMKGLLEGSQPLNGIKYPKQISSFPIKSEMGEYFRKRLKVPLGEPVRAFHLKQYGRTDVKISLLEEGVYFFDFKV